MWQKAKPITQKPTPYVIPNTFWVQGPPQLVLVIDFNLAADLKPELRLSSNLTFQGIGIAFQTEDVELLPEFADSVDKIEVRYSGFPDFIEGI